MLQIHDTPLKENFNTSNVNTDEDKLLYKASKGSIQVCDESTNTDDIEGYICPNPYSDEDEFIASKINIFENVDFKSYINNIIKNIFVSNFKHGIENERNQLDNSFIDSKEINVIQSNLCGESDDDIKSIENVNVWLENVDFQTNASEFNTRFGQNQLNSEEVGLSKQQDDFTQINVEDDTCFDDSRSKCAQDCNFNPKAKDRNFICLNVEKLIPVMDVNVSSIDDKPIKKLRRTFSMSSSNMEKKLKLLGSHETLSGVSNKTDNAKKAKTTASRKKSLDKSTPSFKKSEEKLAQRDEQAKTTSRTDPVKKPVKQRSEIVAAVTQRLYTKLKKKDASTETDDVAGEDKKTLARWKLREITQRMLRAHRMRHVEVQTDSTPVLRIKETSTDVDDLKIDLVELKHVGIATELHGEDRSTNCTHEDFDPVIATNSCGTQTKDNEENVGFDEETTATNQVNPISFTKYLCEPKFEFVNAASPIYTNSVNINVSHNCPKANQPHDVYDNLEDCGAKFSFATPDLISNHNSLESTLDGSKLEQIPNETVLEINHATFRHIPDTTILETNFNTKMGTECSANCATVPKCTEQIQCVNVTETYVPELCSSGDFTDVCTPLRASTSHSLEPTVSEVRPLQRAAPSTPPAVILKSIMKQNQQEVNYDTDSTEDSTNTFGNVGDSLEYHRANKKVRFDEGPTSSGRIFEAMSNFLREATSLMSNLNLAACKLERGPDYDVQLTVNGFDDVINYCGRKRRCRRRACRRYDDRCRPPRSESSQTVEFENASSQTSPKKTTDVTFNKYESSVIESCARLEACINSIEAKKSSSSTELRGAPRQFSFSGDWDHLDYLPTNPDDCSLESNPAFSDYGSLPRTRSKTTGYSPSLHLKQLTDIRRQVIETTRADLLGNDYNLNELLDI